LLRIQELFYQEMIIKHIQVRVFKHKLHRLA